MKLYFAPAACSLAAHIALLEAGLRYELVRVDLRQKTLPDGSDFRQICAMGYVPALQLKNAEVLTELPAVLQYLADQAPASNLAPANGSFARYRLQALLNFIATELHKNFSPLFNPSTTADARAASIQRLTQRLVQTEALLPAGQYLTGDAFTIADAYLFVVLNWAAMVQLDLSPYPQLLTFKNRVSQRPSVQQAFAAEGLSLNKE